MQITWVGLEDEEPRWEPMSTVYADAPKYPEQKLRRMRLNSVSDEARVEAEIWYEPIMCEYFFRWLGCGFHGRTKYTCDGFSFHGHVPDE